MWPPGDKVAMSGLASDFHLWPHVAALVTIFRQQERACGHKGKGSIFFRQVEPSTSTYISESSLMFITSCKGS